ncbi:hypothetical protein IV203_027373 [Nitzschia inconspicua]|uniref:Uncharacterized protein n=1 Tax=Nitzschia inconspicua TaxID=303405 RepID=A0A9K3Q3B3_9STRA|nr:hypothetical protein IV203_027373 [Nitzschia inconspicua]
MIRHAVVSVGILLSLQSLSEAFVVAPSKTEVFRQATTFQSPTRKSDSWRLYYNENPFNPDNVTIVASTASNWSISSNESSNEHPMRSQSPQIATTTTTTFSKDSSTNNDKKAQKLLLPSTYKKSTQSNVTTATPSHHEWLTDQQIIEAQKPSKRQDRSKLMQKGVVIIDRIRARWRIFMESQRVLNPGMKFRVRLGVAVVTIASVLSVILPPAVRGGKGGITSILVLLQKWVAHRGFQGIAALGRSVAYGWALFVAYPRMLDRRAADKKKRDRDRAMERWRVYLRSLAAEVVRLRQELSSIDGEIRAFRREIISLKATLTKFDGEGTNGDDGDEETKHRKNQSWNADIQEAITQEMTHLTQLREDTKQALAAARQTWSEMRAKSPLEAWEADDFLLVSSHNSLPPT